MRKIFAMNALTEQRISFLKRHALIATILLCAFECTTRITGGIGGLLLLLLHLLFRLLFCSALRKQSEFFLTPFAAIRQLQAIAE